MGHNKENTIPDFKDFPSAINNMYVKMQYYNNAPLTNILQTNDGILS